MIEVDSDRASHKPKMYYVSLSDRLVRGSSSLALEEFVSRRIRESILDATHSLQLLEIP